MNKRHGMIAVALVALLLITGCSTFFQGGVSGTVTCDGKPVENATVAVYFDKEVFEEDYAAYKPGKDPSFNTDYKAVKTAQNGSFSITNIPWDSAFPEYGKDADSITAYVLIYHKDYGMVKYAENLHIISGRSNEINPKFPEKLTKTADISILFRNPETHELETGIKTVQISYDKRPGYTTTSKETVEVNGGRVNYKVEYQGDILPDITISEIKYNMYDSKLPYSVVVGNTIGEDVEGNALYAPVTRTVPITKTPDAENNIVINTIPMVHVFAGFNGSLVDDPAPAQRVTIDIHNDVPKVGDLKDPIHHVLTRKPDDRTNIFTDFRGLGSNIVLENKAVAISTDPEITGYPAVIKEDFIIHIKGESEGYSRVTASTDPKTWMDVSLSKDDAFPTITP